MNLRLTIRLAVTGLLFLSFNTAFAQDEHIRGSLGELHSGMQVSRSLTEGVYQESIDHFGELRGQTFEQRYWVDSEFASSGADAPVLYHICGEGDATQGYFLNDNAIAWAQVLGAHLVYLEHRYYGTSQPFTDLSSDHLRYLTLNNVIEDLASFEKWITAQQGWKGKWISIGGSYSGTLSAIYRQKHPELVAGALAASAPMISGVGDLVGSQSDVDSLSSIDTSNDPSDRQWAYQACTTFGFWLADGATPGSRLDTPSPWFCQQLFGDAPYVNTSAYNQSYDAPFISNQSGAPSHILFTYGSNDIWTTLGLSQQTNANPGITIDVISGAGHHFDLNPADPSDSQEVIDARALFVSLAKQWI